MGKRKSKREDRRVEENGEDVEEERRVEESGAEVEEKI